MNIKRILTLVLALTLVFALFSCKKCKDHVDKDDDYKCDNCGKNYDDGDEPPEVTTIDVKFNVKLDSGEPLVGVKFTLVRGDKTYKLTTGKDGSASASLDPGAYSIEYNYDTLPEYCSPDVFGVKIEQGKNSVDLVVVDNKPNGTAAKPYFVSEIETMVTVEPGQEIFYNYRGSSEKYVRLSVSGMEINYNGETFTFADGNVTTLLKPEIGSLTTFSIKNVSSESITTTLFLIAPLGSNENPHLVENGTATTWVSSEMIVYYRWTADKNGVMVVTDGVSGSNISLTKVLENDVSIISQSDGEGSVYMPISAGESIVIGVSLFNSTALTAVTFNVNSYAGTESDPVPMLKNTVDMSFIAGATVVFKVNSVTGKTLSISDESSVTVIHNGEIYTNENGNINISLANTTFTVVNNQDHINGIEIKIKMI